MTDKPRLRTMLVEMFTKDELRQFLDDHYVEVSRAVNYDKPKEIVAGRVVEALDGRRMLDDALRDRLIVVRGTRRHDIEAVFRASGAVRDATVAAADALPRQVPSPDWTKCGADDEVWIVVLESESAEQPVSNVVRKSIDLHEGRIEERAERPLDKELRVVPTTEALASPERWYQVVEALCKAPAVVADATNFEPGIMLLLGVRAVVRRGVTLTASTRRMDDEDEELPFNVQEIKLIARRPEFDQIKHPLHPRNLIGTALADGIHQYRQSAGYQDLPAFDLVRCGPPVWRDQSPLDTILFLCPFRGYVAQWQYLSNRLSDVGDRLLRGKSAPDIVRMLDIESPRLVGAALYEHIRWSTACVADWTRWRANVLFELGVRIACSEFAPLNLIERTTDPTSEQESLEQQRQLRRLFSAAEYDITDESGHCLDTAIDRHEQILDETYVPEEGEVAPGSTYGRIATWYDWRQEEQILSPADELLRAAARRLGEGDYESNPVVPALFANKSPEYMRALRRSADQSLIGAWRYLSTQYTADPNGNEDVQEQLRDVIGRVKRLSKRTHRAIHDEVRAFESQHDLGKSG